MLHRYLDLLEKWNAAYNLTAVRGRKAMEIEHVLDSLAIVPHVQVRDGTVVDVGTGAGLPGLVLAIVLPENRYVLIDSNGKKTRFLTQAAHELGLTNVTVRNERIEDYRPGQHVDVVTSRAFASLADMVQGCRALLADGALALAMKGVRPDDEIAALPADVVVKDVIALRVPGLEKERHLVCIDSRDESRGAKRTE